VSSRSDKERDQKVPSKSELKEASSRSEIKAWRQAASSRSEFKKCEFKE